MSTEETAQTREANLRGHAAFMRGAARQIRELVFADDADRDLSTWGRVGDVLDALSFDSLHEGPPDYLVEELQILVKDTLVAVAESGESASGSSISADATVDELLHVQCKALCQLSRAAVEFTLVEELFNRSTDLDRRFWEAKNRTRPSTSEGSDRLPTPTTDELSLLLTTATNNQAPVTITNIRPLRGINSKDIVFFDQDGIQGWSRSIVMRRMRTFQLNQNASIGYEAELLPRLLDKGIAVPKVLLADAGPHSLGQPFMLLEHINGKARSTDETLEPNPIVVTQMAEHLARIHRLDPHEVGVRDLWPNLSAAERLGRWLDDYELLWRNVQVRPVPVLEHALVWLRARLDLVDGLTSVVHGDFDRRNILVDGSRITAILDWERSHIGHPAEDLAYTFQDVAPEMEFDRFIDLYRAAGGLEVSGASLEFFLVWTAMARVLGAAHVHDAYLRGMHEDFAVAAVGVLEMPALMRQLADHLG